MALFFIVCIVIVIFLFFPKNKNGTNIKKLMRQSARYATAAQQDDSPIIATLHANYAAAFLWALKDIATPREIHKNTGVELKTFEEHVLNVQDMVSKKVVKKCPDFAGDVDLYLSSIAGES